MLQTKIRTICILEFWCPLNSAYELIEFKISKKISILSVDFDRRHLREGTGDIGKLDNAARRCGAFTSHA